MDGLDLIKTFREVATRRSFSRAAASLGLSKSTVSKYVSTLESRSGVRLLNRSTRSLSLTEAGEFLLARSVDIVEIADRTLQELEQYGATAKGRLRLCAPHAVSGGWLPQLLSVFMTLHPDVHISLESRNDAPNLVEEGIDIWINGGAVPNEGLIVTRLFSYEMVLCASPRYWELRGLPTMPEDLRRHSLLSLAAPFNTPIVFSIDGQRQTMNLPSRMDTNDPASLIELAVRDLGPTYVPSPLAAHYLGRGMLVPVLQEFIHDERWILASYAHRRHNSAAMRLMLGFLKEQGHSQFPETIYHHMQTC
ncbi:LysR family transcriptional regulator [Variovorax sp. LT1R16]|uniref:LysR family transcriptional regulator n=1 Tax=Variovorax sp. LT1R16 TaxID=3443728 RepID=UPI003F47E73F